MAKVELKQPIIDEIKGFLDGAVAATVVDYRGLTVAEDTALRKALREAGVQYKVFNFTPDDIPKYIPISGTAFEEDYYYEGEDWIRWESPEGVQYVKIRYWSPKEA